MAGLCAIGTVMGVGGIYYANSKLRTFNIELVLAVEVIGTALLFSNIFVVTAVLLSGNLVKTGGLAKAIATLLSLNVFGKQASDFDFRGNRLSKFLRGLGLVFLGPGFASGVLMRAVVTRCVATTRYIILGIHFFPRNWLRLTLSEDFFTPPAIVPGLPRGHFLHPSSFFRRKSMDVDEWIFTIIFFPIVILPSWTYRVTLKSTAWLYGPVAWIAYVPRKLRAEAGRLIWIDYAGRTYLDWIVFCSALGVLVFAAATAFDPNAYQVARSITEGQPWTPAHLLFAFDPNELHFWHALTIPSASLTLVLIIWTDIIRKRLAAGEVLLAVSAEIRALLAINQLKNLLTVAWIFVTFMSFARTAWLLGYFPEWLSDIFKFIEPISNLWSYT